MNDSKEAKKVFQSGDDECAICLEELKEDACIQLESCGHVWHINCIWQQLQLARQNLFCSKDIGDDIVQCRKSNCRPIEFGAFECALCHKFCEHARLSSLLHDVKGFKTQVIEMARVHAKWDEIHLEKAVTDPNSSYYNKVIDRALHVYTFYCCSECGSPFWGGRLECFQDNAALKVLNAQDRCCINCQLQKNDQVCSAKADHGAEYIIYKCRFCCNVASHLSFGSIHLCDSCYADREITKKVLAQPPTSKPCGNENDECHLKVMNDLYPTFQLMSHSNGSDRNNEMILGCAMCLQQL